MRHLTEVPAVPARNGAPRVVAAAVTVLVLAAGPACEENAVPTAFESLDIAAPAAFFPAPPAGELREVTVGGETQRVWPFTGRTPPLDLGPAQAMDPVSLVLTGEATALGIRAALLGLDGHRTAFGFPPGFPFDCTWTDAHGDPQTGWSAKAGWTGSAVQLACGDFAPLRFHVRFFDAGPWTLGAAHVEVLLPGTAEHQVLAWELPEQLVAADLLRSGAVSPSDVSALALGPAGSWRTIPKDIYNALVGADPGLRDLVAGGPAVAAADVPIATDGRATVLPVTQAPALVPGTQSQSFPVAFEQLIPRPFCGPGFLHASGTLDFSLETELDADGNYTGTHRVRGRLTLAPVTGFDGSGQPILGKPYAAQINGTNSFHVNGSGSRASYLLEQREVPPRGSDRGWRKEQWSVGPGGAGHVSILEKCEP